MKLFKYFGLFTCVTLLLAIISGYAEFDVRIPQERIQNTIDSKLPFHKELAPTHWFVNKAEVMVLPEGRLNVVTTLDGEFKGHHRIVDMAGTFNLAYHDKAFWLSNIEADMVKITKPIVATDPLVVTEVPKGKVKEKLKKIEAETLAVLHDKKEALLGNEKLQNIVDGGEQYIKAHAVSMLNTFLLRQPVYRLDTSSNWKMQTGALVLVKVTTDGRDIVATLDPLGYVVKIVLMVVLSVIFGAIVLFGLVKS